MTALAPGHGDSVLCCTVLAEKRLLASGGEDGTLCFTDLATLKPAGRLAAPGGDAVPALCAHPSETHTLFAAAGAAVLHLDLRRGLGGEAVCRSFQVSADEVNGLAVSAANGGWLAAGDDAGEVAVISLQQPGGATPAAAAAGPAGAPAAAAGAAGAATGAAPPPPSYKTLRRGHANICACVAFRPHRPWELLSGGLDSTVVKWDFSRLRPLHSWSLSAEATASGGQLFNPPMVHSLAVPQGEERGACRLMAVGRGDGCVSLYDADHKPAAASSGGGGTSGSKKGGGKARQRGGGGSGAPRRQGAAAAAGATAVPGRLALLGQEQGGHSAAVNCVSFYAGPGSTSGDLLLSAGNDCRLLLWDWRAAAAAGQEGAEAAAEAAAAADEAGEGPSGAGGGSVRRGGEQGGGAAEAGAGAAEPGGSAPPLVAAEHKLARKINWACSADLPGCPYDVFLADTGRRLTALTLSRA